MDVILLTEHQLRALVPIDRASIDAVAESFLWLAEGRAVVPPIMAIPVPEHRGEVDVKAAYVRGLDSFAVKIASGFYDNARLGLPSGSGLMILFSSVTGVPHAILLDNAYLTDVRTGAAGAVAAHHLARKRIETAGVIGSGTQARFQMTALRQVREFSRLLVYSRDPEHVARYAAEMAPRLGVEVVAAPDVKTVVRGSDVVITTTPARQPYLQAGWLHPGLHITAVGSDMEDKEELDPEVLARADLLACDLKSQCFRLGELRGALQAGLLSVDGPVVELGEIVAGRHPGRTSDEQITVCDLTGVGVQDTAIARLAVQKAGRMEE